MFQVLKSGHESDTMAQSVVLGTVEDLKKEHDSCIARVHRLRELLNRAKPGEYPPLLTGKRLRQMGMEARRG